VTAALSQWLPWIESLGWALVHFIWQGAAIGALYALLRRCLPRERCGARYALGLAALALLAACPVLTLVWLRPHADVVATAFMPQATAGVVDPPMSLFGIDMAGALPWLVLVWMLGALVMSGRAVWQWHVLDRVAERLAERNAGIDALLERLMPRFGFMRRVGVLVSAHIDTPTLIGWIKPVILLPASVALAFPRAQLELILAHELGHLRRCDHVLNLVQVVLETLLYYHPVVHWISRDVRNEREICCDALVLRVTRGAPRDYAHTLAALEELRLGSSRFALAATGGVLVERVRRIVGVPAPRLAVARPNAALWLVVAATVAMTGLIATRVPGDAAGDGAVAQMLSHLPRPDAWALASWSLKLPAPRVPELAVGEPRPLALVHIDRPAPARRAAVRVLPPLPPPGVAPAVAFDRTGVTPVTTESLPPPLHLALAEAANPAPASDDDGDAAAEARDNCLLRTGSRLCRVVIPESAANMTIIDGGGYARAVH
jgi:beta-lactamase regulating signal transducer with metallopeptidase domain